MNGKGVAKERAEPGLMLFVTGASPRSSRARHHLQQALQERGLDETVVEIVDALREPRRVLSHRVFATPTLTTCPPTESALYGDLSNRTTLDRFLDGVLHQD